MSSKDDRLADHLAASGAETIILSFVEGEAIVGPLPILARRSMEWWGRRPSGATPTRTRSDGGTPGTSRIRLTSPPKPSPSGGASERPADPYDRWRQSSECNRDIWDQ